MFSNRTFWKEENPFVYSGTAKVIVHGSGQTLRKLDHTCSDFEMCSVKVFVPKANTQNLFCFLTAEMLNCWDFLLLNLLSFYFAVVHNTNIKYLKWMNRCSFSVLLDVEIRRRWNQENCSFTAVVSVQVQLPNVIDNSGISACKVAETAWNLVSVHQCIYGHCFWWRSVLPCLCGWYWPPS